MMLAHLCQAKLMLAKLRKTEDGSCWFDAVTFSATLVDYSTATFAPTYDIYSQYISAVATAANVGTPSVTITNISPGSVVVATSVNTPSSQAAAFRNKLASGHVFSAGTFGQIDVSNVKTDGASTGGDSSSAGASSLCAWNACLLACLCFAQLDAGFKSWELIADREQYGQSSTCSALGICYPAVNACILDC